MLLFMDHRDVGREDSWVLAVFSVVKDRFWKGKPSLKEEQLGLVWVELEVVFRHSLIEV